MIDQSAWDANQSTLKRAKWVQQKTKNAHFQARVGAQSMWLKIKQDLGLLSLSLYTYWKNWLRSVPL
jgi:hypothetical protein